MVFVMNMAMANTYVRYVHTELNFGEIKAMADKLMYTDKDEYYRRTGKERRKV